MKRLGYAALVSVFLAVIAWLVWPHMRELAGHRRIGQRYGSLRLGMTRHEVSGAMQQEPDCVVVVGAATVAYYAPLPEDVREWPACSGGKGTVASWEELPVVYAAAEVAFDAAGHAVAHGFCGEGGAAAARGRAASCITLLGPDARPQVK
jgi:hypothetical protein